MKDFKVTMNEDQIIWFQPFDFSSHFNGFENDELTKMKITNIPSHGTLKLYSWAGFWGI